MNKILTTFILAITIVLLVSCGGGGSSSSGGGSPSSGGGSPSSGGGSPSTMKSAKVELGPVSGANVVIKALDGYELARYTTDGNGTYTINVDELNKTIRNYDSSMKFVRILAYGGIDTDVNDDKTYLQKEVEGSVSGIIPVDKLLLEKEHVIHLISTAVDKVLGDTINISEEQIVKIAKELGLHDIDGDNNVTIDDLIYYQMFENESRAESELRDFFLDTIHENNTTEQESIVNNLKYEFALISPNVSLEPNSALVSFDPVHDGHYIQFGIKRTDDNVTFSTYYTGSEVRLQTKDVLFFQECIVADNCSKIQKVYFDGQKVHIDYLELPSSNIIDTEKLNTLKAEEEELLKKLEDLEKQKEAIDTKEYEGL